jgi:uncharacterized membrane protein YGL010W
MLKEDHFLIGFCRDLQFQHLEDRKMYRGAHRDWRNRALHRLMIPVECWSALLFSMTLLPSMITVVVGLALGCISLVIATKPSVGVATFVFHLVAIGTCRAVVQSWGTVPALVIAGGSWTIAWALQVGVGHWIWERNQPNVANRTQVSYLAMCQSVLIAWSI